MQVTLNIPNPNDWSVLLPLIERLGISIQTAISANEHPKKTRLSAKTLAYHQAIIAEGGDASYFGDAADWQRQERQDRDDI